MEEYKKYEPIFGSWYLKRRIGSGSFGKVYEITREEYGKTYSAALKIISVPQEDDDVRMQMSAGDDAESVSEYYEDILKEIISENDIMSKLKGNSNIVSYEDHQIIAHDDGIGYDILIRMELLTPLLERMLEKKLDEKEAVKLGIDMCKALEVCHRKNIIHRDIKPQNIFISDNGDYKLGDFGIARTMEKTTGGMSRKGTYDYMAPEVFRGEPYDSTADLYSLGIVLFSLLNGNRGPFLPAPPAKVSFNQKEEARNRRFSGEPLPDPKDAGVMLSYIIKKACEPDPAKRYRTAEQMRHDLESYQENYEEQRTELTPGAAASIGMSAAPQQTAPRYTGPYTVPPQADPRFTGQYTVPPQADPRFTGQYAMPPQYGAMAPAAAQPSGKKSGGGKALKAIAIILGILVLAGGAAAVYFHMAASKTVEIDLADLTTAPEFGGCDGSGFLDVNPAIDEQKRDQLLSSIKDNDKKNGVLELLGSVEYELSSYDGFANGDEVTIYIEYDKSIAGKYGLTVHGTEKTVKVSGLEELPDYLEGAVEYNGHYYKVVNGNGIYWSEAKKACEEQGGHLVTITDEAEQEFIVELIEEEGTMYHYWLGATDEKQEEKWEWVTGEAWGYNNWCNGQPNNTAYVDTEHGQDYLEMQMTHGDQDTDTYTEYGTWTDICDSGVAYNTKTGESFEEAPDYNSTKYYGYICEWDME